MTQTVPLAHLTSSKPTAAEASSRKTLNGLALAVAKAKRIVVVTGAGISCSSGIPDFRSSDGLYNLVKSRYPDVVLKGRDLFDAALFRDPTSSALFYTFMAELKTQIDCARPAPVHDFLAMLDAKGKLLRSYTQNIDGLEERAGLSTQESAPTTTSSAAPRAKNVQLHGDIHRVRCTLCSASYPCAPDHIAQFRTGVPPDCPECIARSDARTARAARALKCGTLRPAIVLYDEPHPLGDHIGAVQTSDLGKKPDLLIVMGTSLKVHGLRSLVKSFAKAVHSSRPVPGANPQKSSARALLHNVLFVNRTPPPPGEWAGILDYHVQGDADTWVAQVLSEWKRVRPVDWEVQSTLDGVGVGQVPRPLGAGKKATQDAAAGGKKAKSTKGKSKAGAGAENMPPEQDDSAPQARFKIVLPGAVGKRRVGGAAGLGKSPLKAHRRIGLSKSVLARSPGLGVSKSGMGKSPLGVSKSPGLLTPAKKATTPFRIGLKRPAASPLTPRQPRIDDMFRDSPISAKRAGSTLSIVPSRQPSEPSQSDSAGPSTSCSTPYPGTSASSSQADLLAPSSQVSRSSTQDSIFSSQDSQSTAASSLADLGSVAELGGDCGAGSSGSGSGLGSQDGGVGGSQSTVGPGSQDTQWSQCTIGVGTQSILGAETQNTLEPETQDTIMASPRPFYRAAIVPAGNRSSEPLSPTRYLGAPRPPPFKSTSVGSGQTLFSGSSQPVASSSKVPTFGPRSQWSRSASQSFGPPPRHSSATGRQFTRHSSTSLLPNHERRATQIPIPGKDFYVSASGERRNYNDPDTDSEEDIPLASQVSITAPPPPSQSMLAARGREELDSDVEVLDEVNPPRGLLFSAKGKGVESDTKMEVVDVDPSSTESDAVASKEDDDSMSLDGAVGHMSLDGPSRETSDTDVDVVGIDSEAEGLALPTASQLARSPVQTRAKRRAKEVQAKRATKRAPRTRVAGTRTSSRLAAMASS